MKRFAIAYFVIQLLVQPSHAAVPDSWKQYASKVGGFSVSFPAAPESHSDKIDAHGIPTTMHTFACEASERVFIVSYNDYPKSAMRDEKQMLVDAEQGAMKNVHGTLIDDQAFKYGDYNARSYAVKVAENHVVRANMFLVGSRLYQVLVVVPASDVDGASVRKFFGSFQLQTK